MSACEYVLDGLITGDQEDKIREIDNNIYEIIIDKNIILIYKLFCKD